MAETPKQQPPFYENPLENKIDTQLPKTELVTPFKDEKTKELHDLEKSVDTARNGLIGAKLTEIGKNILTQDLGSIFPSLKEVSSLKPSTPEWQKQLEKAYAEAVWKKLTADIDHAKKEWTLEHLKPEVRKDIHEEIIGQSLDSKNFSVDGLLDTAKAQAKTDNEDFDTRSPERQNELMIRTKVIQERIQTLRMEYEKIKNTTKTPAEKDKALDDIIKRLFWEKWLTPELKKAITLDVLKTEEGRTKKLRDESPMEIIRRVSAEDAFKNMTITIGWKNLAWDNIPQEIKIQFFNGDKFHYDESLMEKNKALAERLEKAIVALEKKEKETPTEQAARLEKEVWIKPQDMIPRANEVHIPEEKDDSGKMDFSHLSWLGRFILDMLSWIDPDGPFWILLGERYRGILRAYKTQSSNGGLNDTSDRHANTNGTNEYKPNEQLGNWLADTELSGLGFKWDIINSVWKWEYEWPKHKAEVPAADASGLTLCGGIDLSTMKFEDVEKIFAGNPRVLEDNIIQQLKPFCSSSCKRGTAQSLWKTKPELKKALDAMTDEQMHTAFNRDMARDWKNLLDKYPGNDADKIRNAKWCVQSIILSRFYHSWASWSAKVIKRILEAGCTVPGTVDALRRSKNDKSNTWWQNRIGQEIKYVLSDPPDLQKSWASSVPSAQNNTVWANVENNNGAAAIKWFENTKASYGHKHWQYDCMTSVDAAFQLGYTQKYAGAFNGKFILVNNRKQNLWNVSMVAALYAWTIPWANSQSGNTIEMQPNGFYGKDHNNQSNMEYYIEENVM